MEQRDKLADLVNEVDQEAQKFESFDQYLAAREAQNSSETREEWKKSVSDAAVNSPSNGNEKVDETGESLNPSSVAPVSPASESEKAPKTPPPIPPKDELPRPLAAPVLFEQEPLPEPTPKSIDFVVTKLAIHETEWVSGGAFISEEQFAVPEPNEPNSIYLDGRAFCVTAASDDAIIERFHKIEAYIYKAREFQKGLRAGLAARVSGQSSERRAKIKELDKDFKVNINKSSAVRMTRERAPKGAGIELAKAFDTMGDSADEMIDKLKAKGKLDEATIAFIDKNYRGSK